MSAPPLVKVVWIDAAPFKDNQQLLQDVLKAGSGDDACLHLYKGLQNEKPGIAGWVTTWKSQAEHDAVLAIPDHPARRYQPTIFAGAGTENGPKVTIATLEDSLERLETALTSPYTEITELKLKPGQSLSDFEARTLTGITSLKAAGAHAVARARKVGDNETYVVFAGWDSVDAHFTAIAEGTEAGNDLKAVTEVATLEALNHVPLTIFK